MGAGGGLEASGHVLHRYVGAFVQGLVEGGVRDVCLAPGSRSTPLALEVWRDPRIRAWLHLDERSCGFFALGIAKTSRAPVALVCTSGTAALNFAPAVAEASAARVPLVVLTSDRPPELQDVGAAQSMDQTRLFGSFAKRFVALPTPDPAPAQLRYAHHAGARAAAIAVATPSGPVHVNLPFREPLIPAGHDEPAAPATGIRLDDGSAVERPSIRQAPRRPEATDVTSYVAQLRDVERGIIVCGPQSDAALPAQVVQLARVLGFPILADALSGLRCGRHDRNLVVDTYDSFLRDAHVQGVLRPQAVIRLGAPPTSKPLLQFLESSANGRPGSAPRPLFQLLVTDGEGWNDPALLPTQAIAADAGAFCQAFGEALAESDREHPAGRSDWVKRWQTCAEAARAGLMEHWRDDSSLSEPRVLSELADLLPEGATLFVSNSMPVRDLDGVISNQPKELRFLANRGVNGIDGIVSSALGASVACAQPLVLVLGDLAFYHDMNGLLAAQRHSLNATIVVINNDGGGVFSFLPQAREVEEFEDLFGTPHGLTFEHAAAQYGLEHRRIDSVDLFRAAVNDSISRPGVQIIEVPSERQANAALHDRIWSRIAVRASAALREIDA